MKRTMKKAAIALAVAGLTAGLLSNATAATKPVWTDVAGDADANQGTGQSIPAGFDLEKGSIARKGKNLNFTVTHADMLPSGPVPEKVRFLWGFAVGKDSYRITAKGLDIGKPNPVAQSDTDRIGKVDQAFFRLEGNCGSTPVGSLSAVHCPTIAYLKGAFDPASKSFTVEVPMKLIKAKPGSKIGPGGGDAVGICAICWVSHVAERSLNTTIIDAAAQAGFYTVPR